MTALPTIIPLVNIKVWEAFTLSQPPTMAFFWVIQCIKLVVGEDHVDERKHCDWLFSKVNQCTRRETERERKKRGLYFPPFQPFSLFSSSIHKFLSDLFVIRSGYISRRALKKCCLIITTIWSLESSNLRTYKLVVCWLQSLRCVQVQLFDSDTHNSQAP